MTRGNARTADDLDFSALEARPGDRTVPRVVIPRPKRLQALFFYGITGAVFLGTWAILGAGILLGIRFDQNIPVGSLLLAAGLLAIAVGVVVFVIEQRWNRRHALPGIDVLGRLPEFAAANGFDYESVTRDIPFGHLFFDTGLQDPRLQWVLRSRSGRETVIGTSVADIPQGRGRPPFPVGQGFAAIRLDREVPHVLLVPRTDFAPGIREERRRMFLEGDFPRYFTLYCEPGAEIEALTVLTPDVMAAMVDDATLWTAEIEGDWLVFSYPVSFGLFGAAEYRRVFELLDEVGGEFVQQTDVPTVVGRDLAASPIARERRRRAMPLSGKLQLAWLGLLAVAVFAVPGVLLAVAG